MAAARPFNRFRPTAAPSWCCPSRSKTNQARINRSIAQTPTTFHPHHTHTHTPCTGGGAPPMEVIIGCVGKPSVGKSTFFNAVTDGKVRFVGSASIGFGSEGFCMMSLCRRLPEVSHARKPKPAINHKTGRPRSATTPSQRSSPTRASRTTAPRARAPPRARARSAARATAAASTARASSP